jgi:hypothetical protein
MGSAEAARIAGDAEAISPTNSMVTRGKLGMLSARDWDDLLERLVWMTDRAQLMVWFSFGLNDFSPSALGTFAPR